MLARLAFDTYRQCVNASGGNVRLRWEDLPFVMQEAWLVVVETLRAHISAEFLSGGS